MKLKPRVLISSRFREDSSQTVNITIRSSSTLIRLSTAGKDTGQTSWRQSNREHAETYVSGETTWMHAGLEACTCSWTHAHRTASQHVDAANVHVSFARMHAVVHACTRHMHACSSTCMRARGTCARARRICMRATRHMHACSSMCMRARGTCTRARGCARVQSRVLACTDDVLASPRARPAGTSRLTECLLSDIDTRPIPLESLLCSGCFDSYAQRVVRFLLRIRTTVRAA